jgi:hypothetical protein
LLQLVSIFAFTFWYTRSGKGACVALLVTAFSLFNVKFLLFDIFRPDHLAYALIVLQSYWALQGRFYPLLLSTMLGLQIREFDVIPLIAYLFSMVGDPMARGAREGTPNARVAILLSVVGLGMAAGLPRLLIPVSTDFQFASLTRDGVLRVLLAPLVLARDANFLYSIVAYLLPSLMLAGISGAGGSMENPSRPTRRYFGAYSGLVLILSFLGGTDFYRFSSYLFLPQALFVALISRDISVAKIGLILAAVAVFNRLWQPFPMSDVGQYLDFYGGFGTRLDTASVWRFAECLILIALALLAGQLFRSEIARSHPGRT